MQTKQYDLMLDIKSGLKTNEKINLVTDDLGGTVFAVHLTDKAPISLTDITPRLIVRTPSGATLQSTMTVSTLYDDVATLTLEKDMFVEVGEHIAEVQLWDSVQMQLRLTTPQFKYYVHRSLQDDKTVQAQTAFSLLQDALAKIGTFASALQFHIADAVRHVTAAERSAWNAKETTTGAQEKADNAKQEAINTAKTLFSNSNSFDNWDFRNPVNQRAVSVIGTSGYGIDRWLNAAGANVDVHNGYLTLNATSVLSQRLPQYKVLQLVGKTVTVSYMDTDGVIYTGSTVYPSLGTSAVFLNNADFQIYIPSADNTIVQFLANRTKNIKCVKLEPGSVSTLANDPVSDYGDMLALCQRYYERITGFRVYNSKAGLTSMAAENLYIFFATKRIIPTVSFEYELSSNPNNWIKSSPTHIDVNKFTDFSNVVFDCEFVSVRNVVIDANIY